MPGICKKIMAKIKYNKQAKILSIRLDEEKSVDSDIKKNIVVDYDKHGNIVNIDIMNINLDEFSKINFNLNQIFKKERIYS